MTKGVRPASTFSEAGLPANVGPQVRVWFADLRSVILQICPNCLIGRRGDQAWIYFPPERSGHQKQRVFVTMWPRRSSLRLDIGPLGLREEKFAPQRLPFYRDLLERRYDTLRGIETIDVEKRDLTDEEIDELIRTRQLRIGMVATDTPQRLARQRRGQARIHELTGENYGWQCAVCDVSDRALLVASYILGWAASPEHRGDLSNVICLCRIHDALFERGYWSLDDNLVIIRKNRVEGRIVRLILDQLDSFRAPLRYAPGELFIKRHRHKAGLNKRL